jgi:transposase
MEQWVDQYSEVRLIDVVVDGFVNENEFTWSGKSNKGCTSYSPATMLKLLLYCYYNWIPGSRRMEKEAYRNIEVIWLLGGLKPDHWTICKFRRENKELIRNVAISLRKFLIDNGYIERKTIAFDGSKMKAYAARDMVSAKVTSSRLENIEQQLDKYLDNVEETDNLEGMLEEEVREKEQLKKQVEELKSEKHKLEILKDQMEEKGINYLSPTDPDARLMKCRDGKLAGYNVQSGVDGKHHMIALAEVTNEQCDINLLKEDYENLINQLGVVPGEVLADKGYANAGNIQHIHQKPETECFIPIPEPSAKSRDKKNGIKFIYNQDEDNFTCPNNKKLHLIKKGEKKNGRLCDRYQCRDCNGCPIKEKCTSSKVGRMLYRPVTQSWIDQYKEWVQKPENLEKLKKRQTIVEHPFGTIKMIMGKFCFLLRKIPKVQIEVDIYSTVYNLKRLTNIEKMQDLLIMAKNYNWKMA